MTPKTAVHHTLSVIRLALLRTVLEQDIGFLHKPSHGRLRGLHTTNYRDLSGSRESLQQPAKVPQGRPQKREDRKGRHQQQLCRRIFQLGWRQTRPEGRKENKETSADAIPASEVQRQDPVPLDDQLHRTHERSEAFGQGGDRVDQSS